MAIYRRSFKGAGSWYLAPYDMSTGFVPMGNISEAVRSIATESDSVTDYESLSGGIADLDERVTEVKLDFTCYNFAPHMAALANRGTANALSAGAVVDEEVTAWPETMVPFAFQPDSSVAPVVESKDGKTAAVWAASTAIATGAYRVPTVANTYYYKATTGGTSGSSQPTWPTTVGGTVTDGGVTWTNMGKIVKVAGTDYVLSRSGILMTAAAGCCEPGRPLLVDYTKLAGSVIEAITAAGTIWKLLFDGANTGAGGKPVTIRGHRVKFSPADSFPSISDKFASYKLTATFTKDDAILAAGKSQYLNETWGD